MTGLSLTFNALGRRLLGGWGRRAAGAMLLLFLALQVGADSLFDAPRLALFDAYQRLMPREHATHPVLIVQIDDKSLKALGQWPWPRQLEAQLVSRIMAGNPAALGIDLLWPEPDGLSPEQWLHHESELPAALADSLSHVPGHDAMLHDALAKGPVAVGLAGDASSAAKKDDGARPPVLVHVLDDQTDPARILPGFPTSLRSIQGLDAAAAGHGVLSVTPDPDGIFRRLPLVSRVSGNYVPALSLEVLRLANRVPVLELYFAKGGMLGAKAGDLVIPTQRDGTIWVNFTPTDPTRFVSAVDVLRGHLPQGVSFDRLLVLLGVTGLGETDQRMTPQGQMPGVEIQAQLLENIFDGNPARRPGWARYAEPGLTLLFGLLLIIAAPLLRGFWQFAASLAALAALAAVGILFWHHDFTLVDVATPMIAQSFVAVALLGGGFAEADKQRKRLRQELETRRLAAARTEGELEAARRIQKGILPSPASMAADPRFDLDALMVPAREIGGDLFDFFKLDADHLYFAVGDVSGKGMPAALFMALGKSLCKSSALRGDHDIGAIINRANREISRDNTETLFITMFAGILDLATGALRFCNAGHDAPFLLRGGERPYSLESEGGPPLCILEDFDYPSETFQLQPGDLLCIITDGVTEAMTKDGVVMGRDKAQAALAALPPGADARMALHSIEAAVAAFVAGAEASDDLTILAVRWHGP
jgi:serine phosphatase RsbU (regulator of sigma subunit)/CHASE2 domain-containing sensor protein